MSRARTLALLLSATLPAVGSATDTRLAGDPAPKLHFDPFQKPAELAAPPPAPAVAVRQPETPTWSPALRGVMVAGARSMANVDGELVGMGEEIEGHRLVEVTERRAVFERGGVLLELVIE